MHLKWDSAIYIDAEVRQILFLCELVPISMRQICVWRIKAVQLHYETLTHTTHFRD